MLYAINMLDWINVLVALKEQVLWGLGVEGLTIESSYEKMKCNCEVGEAIIEVAGGEQR